MQEIERKKTVSQRIFLDFKLEEYFLTTSKCGEGKKRAEQNFSGIFVERVKIG